MQSLQTPADSQSTADTRYPRAMVRFSWNRALSSGVLAVVGSSLVGGLDLVAGQENQPMPWDDYVYNDETDYVIAFDYDREIEEPQGGVAGATLDVVLDNTSKRFTPDYNATVGTALTSNRPLIVDCGFLAGGSQRTVPVFKGSTFSDIEPNYENRTANYRAADIITLLDQTTLAAAIYTNQRSDQIIEAILNDAGLGSTQYELNTGLNTIEFAWFPSKMHALERIRMVCEAEEGTFYQSERGKCRFETRLHYKKFPYNTNQIALNKGHLLNYQRIKNNTIINRCVVLAKPRQVDDANSDLWYADLQYLVAGNTSRTVWANPTDADSSESIIVSSVAVPSSTTDYTAFTEPSGAGTDKTADQTVTVTNYGDTVKIVLANASASPVYYNLLKFRGKAARVQRAIEAISEDADSQNKYGIQEFTIENDLIQDADWAEELADDMVAKYNNPTTRLRVKIPALPHLQLKDKVSVLDPDTNATTSYRVMRIQGKFIPGSYTQDVVLRQIDSTETAT